MKAGVCCPNVGTDRMALLLRGRRYGSTAAEWRRTEEKEADLFCRASRTSLLVLLHGGVGRLLKTIER